MSERKNQEQARPQGEATQPLIELRDRLQKATGPKRRLDADIASAGGWKAVQKQGRHTGWHGRRPRSSHTAEIPRYTASLDAAVTLVPGGITCTDLFIEPDEAKAILNYDEIH